MKKGTWLPSIVTALAAVLLAVSFVPAAPPEGSAPPEMSPEQKAMMEAYMKAATPGPVHQEMAKLEGKWKLDVTSWMAPGAPPETSQGTAEFRPLLGGRFMRQEVHGDMGGQPFDGFGIEGFDNVSNERWGMWVDTMGTGAMMSRGKCGAGEKVCKMSGSYNDPISGKTTQAREVLTRTSDHSFNFDMYGPDPSGKEFKMMSIVYTRQ